MLKSTLALALSRWHPLLLTAALSPRATLSASTLHVPVQFTSYRQYAAEAEVTIPPLSMDSTSSIKLPIQLYEPEQVTDMPMCCHLLS
jgi:hypothetical protein